MSEAKFTPAPWVIINQAGYEAINNDELGLNVCTFTSRVDDTSHDKNLIAAAPEMYKEIESEISILEGQLIDAKTHGEASRLQDRIIRKVKLLTKARGEHD